MNTFPTRLRPGLALFSGALSFATLAWFAFWAYHALTLWRRHRIYQLVVGPYLPYGPGEVAWQRPLIVALLPVALLGMAWALYCIVQGLRAWVASRTRPGMHPRQ